MSQIRDELISIAVDLEKLIARGEQPSIQQPLTSLQSAAEEIGRAWSGSCLGYHADVYYRDFNPPPPGKHFSQEWGLMFRPEDWLQHDPHDIVKLIHNRAGNPDVAQAESFHSDLLKDFNSGKMNALSLIEIAIANYGDDFFGALKKRIDSLSPLNVNDEMKRKVPSRNIISRDTVALSQGRRISQHVGVMINVKGIQHTLYIAKDLAKSVRLAAAHISRLHEVQSPHQMARRTTGAKIFIGHGRSNAWLELEKFISQRLKLDVDSFDSTSVAGKSHKERLSEMLDAAAFAFLVMTAEDEQAEGTFNPRMNVVHEAGLFQGRIGFERAIVLLEQGCQEFSNIAGLGQIRFPKGEISARFEEIRRVLEREQIL